MKQAPPLEGDQIKIDSGWYKVLHRVWENSYGNQLALCLYLTPVDALPCPRLSEKSRGCRRNQETPWL